MEHFKEIEFFMNVSGYICLGVIVAIVVFNLGYDPVEKVYDER